MQRVSPVDAAWLALESRDTPMHVGGLFEFTLPPNAPADYLEREFERCARRARSRRPGTCKLVEAPLLGSRVPLMREIHDVDLDYHVRHSALPHPGGQRELGVLVSRLHSHQLDLHRPLWEVHLIEGLEGNRFAMYSKMHHSLVDGVSGMRLIMRDALRATPTKRGHARRSGPSARASARAAAGADGQRPRRCSARPLGVIRGRRRRGRRAVPRRPRPRAWRRSTSARCRRPTGRPHSVLGGSLGGQRRFATQQYELARIKRLAQGGRLHAQRHRALPQRDGPAPLPGRARALPDRPLTAGIPVNLREADDQSMGTSIGVMIAELGTNVADPMERLRAIRAPPPRPSATSAGCPPQARTSYTLLLNAPYIAGLIARPRRPRAGAVQRRHLQRARARPSRST